MSCEHPKSGVSSSNQRPFQGRVVDWMMETFSMEVCRNTTERNHRFLEEALELVQAMGCTAAEAHMLVDYTFGRPVGDPEQEVGGALVTLAALCSAADISMAELGERELARCWQLSAYLEEDDGGEDRRAELFNKMRGNRGLLIIDKDTEEFFQYNVPLGIDRIRFKQAGKPRSSPLPGPSPVETQPVASNPDHERWLAETWKMIETCATDIRSSNVTLSPEGCRALLGERNAHETKAEPVAWTVEASHDGSLCEPFLERKDAYTYANTKAPQHPGVRWTVVPLYRSSEEPSA